MRTRSGFTLIELSIVLVIIGLITGGILLGRDLISAAAVRAQVSQIERYQAAVNTFRGKYGYLPGDIPDPDATSFGFQPRGPDAAEGDGNGIIQGINAGSHPPPIGTFQQSGETAMFWRDLSDAQLLDGSFSTATPDNIGNGGIDGPIKIAAYLPAAKIGSGNFVYVWSGGISQESKNIKNNLNYFGLSQSLAIESYGFYNSTSLSVAQAYAIDSKIDDGLPQFGKVLALYINIWPQWAGSGGCCPFPNNFGGVATAGMSGGGGDSMGTTISATGGSSTTCYDNNNLGGTEHYSMGQDNGANLTCGMSFQFE